MILLPQVQILRPPASDLTFLVFATYPAAAGHNRRQCFQGTISNPGSIDKIMSLQITCVENDHSIALEKCLSNPLLRLHVLVGRRRNEAIFSHIELRSKR